MPGQRLGNVRVSSFDQNPERQLEYADVARVFTDHALSKDIKRPQLDILLSLVRGAAAGEQKSALAREFGICRDTLHQSLRADS